MKPSSAIAIVIAGFILAGVIAAIYKIDNATKENAEFMRNSIASIKEEAANGKYRLEDEIDAKVSAADLKEEVRAQFESREKVDKESIKKEVLDTFNSCSFFEGTLKDGLSCNDICQTPKIWEKIQPKTKRACWRNFPTWILRLSAKTSSGAVSNKTTGLSPAFAASEFIVQCNMLIK